MLIVNGIITLHFASRVSSPDYLQAIAGLQEVFTPSIVSTFWLVLIIEITLFAVCETIPYTLKDLNAVVD
jgi:hypothetical protein